MTLKHDNPTKKRQGGDWARAPYNFVPLPEKMVPAPENLPPHSTYRSENQKLLSGWIECEIETYSPTYVRGMPTRKLFEIIEKKQASGEELSIEEKQKLAPFFAITNELVEGFPAPAIPGSSLRGMLRALVEVIGFGRMRYVDAKPTFTYRAVAASRDDPLRDPYRDVIGAFGKNVKAGYLKKGKLKGKEVWMVQPALTPADMDWPDRRSTYLKVKERSIDANDIPGFLRFNSADYKPQLHPVSFNVRIGHGQRGSYIAIGQIGKPGLYEHKGVLVCSGNMLETGKEGQKSPRKNHALVLAESNTKSIIIDDAAIEDYVNGLTPFEREDLKDWKSDNGCLRVGNPVFYVTDGNRVIQFGHCPNFRVSARQNWFDKERASTPLDFVPKDIRAEPEADLAEAIFGWVDETEKGWGPSGQRAGRVYVGDALFQNAGEDGIWYKPEPITPHVLSSPKPTTFQHYLVQSRKKHDPDEKSALAHYGTPGDETQIRGHKFYWFKGATPDIEATQAERAHESQLTRMMPLKPSVRFKFKIHFENLREAELGVLWWALTLPGDSEKTYCHQIGMGKPLGLGAVKITPYLHLTDRRERYAQLFSDDAWQTGEITSPADEFVQAFEDYLRNHNILVEQQSLADLDRIQALLTMMEWEANPDPKWLDMTRYMEIEHGAGKVNEYKERPVLPTPQGVRQLATGHIPAKIQTQQTPPGYVRGRVRDFGLGANKSFGFIQPDGGGPEVFVHINQLSGSLDWLEPGQAVVFKIGKGQKGPAAFDVRLVE